MTGLSEDAASVPLRKMVLLQKMGPTACWLWQAGMFKSAAFLRSLARLTTLFIFHNARFDHTIRAKDFERTLRFTTQLTALRSLRVTAPAQAW